MEILTRYPIDENVISSYIGRTVGAVTAGGDVFFGVVDRLRDGHIVMRPLDGVPDASISKVRSRIETDASIKSVVKATNGNRSKRKSAGQRATTSASGPAFVPFPYGYSYGNYGWGPDGGGYGRCFCWPPLSRCRWSCDGRLPDAPASPMIRLGRVRTAKRMPAGKERCSFVPDELSAYGNDALAFVVAGEADKQLSRRSLPPARNPGPYTRDRSDLPRRTILCDTCQGKHVFARHC